jgi:hypothetical protein
MMVIYDNVKLLVKKDIWENWLIQKTPFFLAKMKVSK